MYLRIFAYSKEEEDSFYPLCGLNRELRSLAGNNVLEELELDVSAQSNEETLPKIGPPSNQCLLNPACFLCCIKLQSRFRGPLQTALDLMTTI